MSIKRKGRYWAVMDDDGRLVCLTVYRRGAREVLRRLKWAETESPQTASSPPEGVQDGR